MKAWEEFLALQDIELGRETVNKWLRPLKIAKFDACNLYLEAKDTFQVLWFEEHIRRKVKAGLLNNNHKAIKIHINVANAGMEKREKGLQKDLQRPTQPFRITYDNLDPNLSFSRFVPNQQNELAYKVLSEITGYDRETESYKTPKTPLAAFNPLYIYGPGGVGKTHLLTATTQALRKQGHHTIYVRTETFTDHVVKAIRAGEMKTFREAYRNSEVLIIDDVHILSRKGATQEELFHTFNTLHLAGKQIILSANCPPCELQHIEARLVSRFEWGLSLPIDPYTQNELREILKHKAAAFNFPLRNSISDYLLETFKSSPAALIRSLEALILRTHIKGSSSSTTLGIPTVKRHLTDLILEEEQQALTHEKIIQKVSDQFGIKVEDILSKSQSRDCVLPRQLAMFLCREKLQLPYMKIGDIFSRDHSTVMSSVKLIQKGIDEKKQDIESAYHAIAKTF